MSEEEKKGVNTGDEEVIQNDGTDITMDDHDAGIGSPANELETHNLDIDDYDEVIDNANKLAEEEASGETEKTGDSTDDEGEVEKKGEEEDARVPKSRLDKVISERNQEREERAKERDEYLRKQAYLEGRLEALEKGIQPKEEKPVTSPFDELLSGEPQEILDALQENPAEFFQNLKTAAQVKAQADIKAEQQEEAYYRNLREGLDAFAADHDGFVDSLEKMSGVIESNPIHNLVSAYAYEVEIPALKAAHEEALSKATGDLEAAKAEGIKIGKAEALKEFKAKGAAALLDGSQSTQGSRVSPEPELQNTEKSGGLAAILTEKLLKRRAARGG